MKARLNFARTDTAIVLDDLTINKLRLTSDPTTEQVGTLDDGATLENAGLGEFYLNCPLVTEEATVDVEVTGDAGRWASGVFSDSLAIADLITNGFAALPIPTIADIRRAGIKGLSIGLLDGTQASPLTITFAPDSPLQEGDGLEIAARWVDITDFSGASDVEWLPLYTMDDQGVWTKDSGFDAMLPPEACLCYCCSGSTDTCPSGVVTITINNADLNQGKTLPPLYVVWSTRRSGFAKPCWCWSPDGVPQHYQVGCAAMTAELPRDAAGGAGGGVSLEDIEDSSVLAKQQTLVDAATAILEAVSAISVDLTPEQQDALIAGVTAGLIAAGIGGGITQASVNTRRA